MQLGYSSWNMCISLAPQDWVNISLSAAHVACNLQFAFINTMSGDTLMCEADTWDLFY